MNTESSKEKKKEILELFTSYNKLRSEEEFNEISYDLHNACKKGDLELIKILLCETIEDSTNTLKFKIDKTNQTASLLEVENEVEELNIPRTIEHESTEYLITSIIGTCCDIKTVKFSEDSAVKTFYKDAFCDSEIEEIYFPASLKELKEGWCLSAANLNKIIISPLNGQFEFKENKYLVYKNDTNNDECDKLLFVRRDIEKFSIPSNIKIISSCAFNSSNIKEIFIPSKVSKIYESAFFDCENLRKVEIPLDSDLETIESKTFAYSKIESICIPPKVSKICENAFSDCCKLKKVEFPTNSNLQIIELNAFFNSSIESIFIPSKVAKICEFVFSCCDNLQIIEISEESELKSIPFSNFFGCMQVIIMIPTALKEFIIE